MCIFYTYFFNKYFALFFLPVEVDCSDGDAVGGITLKSNPPSAACTKKKNTKKLVKKITTKARTHRGIWYAKIHLETGP